MSTGLNEELRKRLLASATRLVRLVQITAPDAILQIEGALLCDRLKMLDPKSWARREASAWRQRNAHRYGYCAEADCDEPLVDAVNALPLDLCPTHTAQALADEAEDQAEADAEDQELDELSAAVEVVNEATNVVPFRTP